MAEKQVGVVTHFFGKIGVAAMRMTDGEIKVGDTIHIKGHTTDFTQMVDSMQVEHASVTTARTGDEVGIKVAETVHEHDSVFKIID